MFAYLSILFIFDIICTADSTGRVKNKLLAQMSQRGATEVKLCS